MTHMKSIDPATGETVWEGVAASPAEVQAAADRARAAFPDWADRSRHDRIDAVKRYQAVLKARAPQMAEAISRETGKALWETTAELGAMAGKVDISIRAYDERTGERTAETGFGHATLRAEIQHLFIFAQVPHAFIQRASLHPIGLHGDDRAGTACLHVRFEDRTQGLPDP